MLPYLRQLWTSPLGLYISTTPYWNLTIIADVRHLNPFWNLFPFLNRKVNMWRRGVMGFSFMELRDLGEIDFYSIFSLLCWTESKMLRAVSLCFYFLQIEIWKFSLRPPFFLHIDFCPPWKNVSMGPSKLSYPGKKSSAHNNRICLKLC